MTSRAERITRCFEASDEYNRSTVPRILLHLADRHRRPVAPAEIYYLEAAADDTLIRLRGRQLQHDVRRLAELEALTASLGFLRIHDSYVVNLERIYEIRPRKVGSRDWEVVMEPPVNRVLPISRLRVEEVWQAFGGE
jgi:DNA-binding LytR/AlgR family response regulator